MMNIEDIKVLTVDEYKDFFDLGNDGRRFLEITDLAIVTGAMYYEPRKPSDFDYDSDYYFYREFLKKKYNNTGESFINSKGREISPKHYNDALEYKFDKLEDLDRLKIITAMLNCPDNILAGPYITSSVEYWCTNSVLYGGIEEEGWQVIRIGSDRLSRFYDTVRTDSRCYSIRPALKYSYLEVAEDTLIIDENYIKIRNGEVEIEFGEYPQCAVHQELQNILEKEYKNKRLLSTGNTYTFDSRTRKEYKEKINPITYGEYIYDNRKFVRVRVTSNWPEEKICLSNGQSYHFDEYVWIEVLPVKWLVDSKTNTLISKYGLLSGIRFYKKKLGYWDFYKYERSDMSKYLKKYMLKDLLQSLQDKKEKNDSKIYLESPKRLLMHNKRNFLNK